LNLDAAAANGLLSAEMHIKEVAKLFSVAIDLYGFDAGTGLPAPTDYRDMPHYFRQGLYEMDRGALEQRLERANLVIGNIRDTCTTFLQKCKPAPIGCVLHDLDYYSSTRDALTLFDAEPSHFLPRVIMYFDDIVGDETWLCNEFTGELLAVDEFNQKHRMKKICKNRVVAKHYPHSWWGDLVYVYHDFEHPRYNDFVADEQQLGHQHAIRLKMA
jgi:hypothetical protein